MILAHREEDEDVVVREEEEAGEGEAPGEEQSRMIGLDVKRSST